MLVYLGRTQCAAATKRRPAQCCTRVHTVDLEPVPQVARLVPREELQQFWADFEE